MFVSLFFLFTDKVFKFLQTDLKKKKNDLWK